MSHLLRIASSILGDQSTSRALTRRAADRWHETHPGGSETYRDLGEAPLPHFDTPGGLARMVAPDQHTPAQAESYARSVELIDELKQADTVLLGLPLYNFGPPSTVKSWIDYVIAPGVSFNPATGEGFVGEPELVVLGSRGGGYAPGQPREGWDHAEPWLPHALSLIGIEPRFLG